MLPDKLFPENTYLILSIYIWLKNMLSILNYPIYVYCIKNYGPIYDYWTKLGQFKIFIYFGKQL